MVAGVLTAAAAAAHVVASPRAALTAGTGPCPTGLGPAFPAYDPSNKDLYVPNEDTHNVTILAPNCTQVGNVVVPNGSDPFYAVYNPSNNYVYVDSAGHGKVFVIHNSQLIHTISGVPDAYGMVYDPGLQSVIVVDDTTYGYVTVIQGFSILGTAAVGGDPAGIDYDPYTDTILVADALDSNVTILEAQTLTTLGTVPVGAGPAFIAFDPADSMDYVTNSNGGNLTVMNGVGGSRVSVGLSFLPWGIAFDQKNLDMYVTGAFSGGVAVVHGLSVLRYITLASGSAGFGLAFGIQEEEMLVANYGLDEVDYLS